MPIQFRCAYCNQLMQIARRKAGTVVRCKKCNGEVIVPTPPATDPQPDNPISPVNEAFEVQDFESYLAPLTPEPDPPAPAKLTPPVPAATSRGVTVPPVVLALAAVAMLGLMLLSCVIGVVNGRVLAPAHAPAPDVGAHGDH